MTPRAQTNDEIDDIEEKGSLELEASQVQSPGADSMNDRGSGVLPEKSRKKFAKMKSQVADFRAIIWGRYERQKELRSEKEQAEMRVRQLTDHDVAMQFGTRLAGDDHPDVIAKKAAIVRCTAELAEIDERSAEVKSKLDPLARLCQSIEKNLARLPAGSRLPQYDVGKVKIAKGQSINDAIDAERETLSDLRFKLSTARDALWPSADVKKKLPALVDAKAAEGAPNVRFMLEGADHLEWPTCRVSGGVVIQTRGADGSTAAGAGHFSGATPDALAILCWLHRDAMIERLASEVDRFADDANALSDEQRATFKADLSAQILRCERREEALIEQAEANGLTIARREDASWVAVLGVDAPDFGDQES